jgi:hypothetical protein
MIGVIKRHLGKIPGLDIQLCKALKCFSNDIEDEELDQDN